MSVRLLREYLGYRPTYLANTFVINDDLPAEKSSVHKSKYRKNAAKLDGPTKVGAEDDDDAHTELSESDDDTQIDDLYDDGLDLMPGDYPETDDKMGGFIELITGAYEALGHNTATVFGGGVSGRSRKKSTEVARYPLKSASTVSAEVRSLFARPINGGVDEHEHPINGGVEDDLAITKLLEDLARGGSDPSVVGGFTLDLPDESDDIWGIIDGGGHSAELESIEIEDEEAAGLSIMDIIAD